MKRLCIGLLLISCLIGFSQSKEDAKRDAEITAKATLEMDFKTVLKHTLPSVVEMMGGEETALGYIKSMFDSMKAQGFVFEKADVVSVSDIVEEQGQHRCVIENMNQMKMSNQRIKSKSYLLGIYNNKADFWWFIEAKQLKNKALVNQIIPDFKTSLDIPEDEIQSEPIED
ncbi:hypothetical protein [Winogradskyella sp.]|uniref:hypothetical protein n=1 Tax=Winogradskyella sp. TaxID=1883156 RepID=UPI002631D69A|nr:hypothetical protein [Winogradskyella sp.]